MAHKKSQIALEFLMTYGWAILASMVALAALAYFGITSPAKTLPEKCIFANNFACIDSQITDSDNTARAILVNGQGQTIYNPRATMANANCNIDNSNWPTDTQRTVTCQLSSGDFIDGNKAKVKITLQYEKVSGSYDHVALGEVYTTVQA